MLQRYFSVYVIVIFIKNDQIQLIQLIFAMIVGAIDVQLSSITCKIGNFYQRLLPSTIFAVIWFTKSSLTTVIAVWCRIFNNDSHFKFNKVRNQQRQKNFCTPPMMVENHHRSFNYLEYHN